MNKLELLKAAREKIAKPEYWTKGDFARDVGGKGVAATDPAACCFCAHGAIHRVRGLHNRAAIEDACWATAALNSALTLISGHDTVPEFNDAPETRHADVMALFDVAIQCAEAAA